MKQKLKDIFLFLFVFNLPFQLGKHFWLTQSFVKGFRIDYLSPTFYLTDLFIIFFLLFNLSKLCKILKSLLTNVTGISYLSLLFLNLWASNFNSVTSLAWLRLTVYLLLFLVLKETPHLIKKIKLPLIASLVIVVTVALLQLVRQSSLGGLFYLFGERPLSVSLPNIAKLKLDSLVILRPYSTFSHPNSLAGYLLIIYIILNLISKSKLLKLLVSLVIISSFSKTAILALVLIEIFQLSTLQSLLVSVLVSFVPLVKNAISLPTWILTSFSSRAALLLTTVKLIPVNWFAGVGLRQFVPKFSELLPSNQISLFTLQPVHNTFLLIFAETGVLGVILIIKIIYDIFIPLFKNKQTRTYAKKILGVVLITSSLDHYWWTLPQNQLIILLSLALLVNTSNFPLLTKERARVR